MNVHETEQPYKGRVGIFFGGSSGTGLVAAVEYQKKGGGVYLGASSESSYKRALASSRYLGGDRSAFLPIIGDVTNSGLLRDNIMGVVNEQKKDGNPVTDVFVFAAGGMPFAIELEERFLAPMRAVIVENPSNKDELLAVKKAELQRQYALWLPASHKDAYAVNVQAKIDTVNFVLEATKGEQRPTFIDFNSTFGKEGVGPGFYGNVSIKRMFSDLLKEYAKQLAEQGMDTAEFIAPVIEDTGVGGILLNKVVPIIADSHPDVAALMFRTRIKRVDVPNAMSEFILMSRAERAREERPYERYIVGDNEVISVVRSIPEELRIDAGRFDI